MVIAHNQMEQILSGRKLALRKLQVNKELKFFIKWIIQDHPSKNRNAVARILEIDISGDRELTDSWFKSEILEAFGDIKSDWKKPTDQDYGKGIIKVTIMGKTQILNLD